MRLITKGHTCQNKKIKNDSFIIHQTCNYNNTTQRTIKLQSRSDLI